jgi:hypothetical protein
MPALGLPEKNNSWVPHSVMTLIKCQDGQIPEYAL